MLAYMPIAYFIREEHDRRVAQQMHDETSKEVQRQREMEVCVYLI